MLPGSRPAPCLADLRPISGSMFSFGLDALRRGAKRHALQSCELELELSASSILAVRPTSNDRAPLGSYQATLTL